MSIYESTPEFIKENRAKAIQYGLDLGALSNLTDDEAAHYANGCGPSSNGTKNIFSRIINEAEFAAIPNHTVDGTDFTPACIVHDCDYEMGQTEHDRALADLRLHANIRKIIKATSPHFIRDFDYFMADIFYEAVSHFGKSDFENKDPV